MFRSGKERDAGPDTPSKGKGEPWSKGKGPEPAGKSGKERDAGPEVTPSKGKKGKKGEGKRAALDPAMSGKAKPRNPLD